MSSILQWNVNGCIRHFAELEFLITQISPFCICLQETHFRPETTFALNGYNCYRYEDPTIRGHAKGGVATFVKPNVPCIPIQIQSPLQATAVQLTYKIKFTVCNVYLPSPNWTLQQLQGIVDQLSQPFVIIGDFNAHNPRWGSERLDSAGRRVADILDSNNLVLFNTGAGTYLNSISGKLSALDLAFCSPILAPMFTWRPRGCDLFSDHFPITLSFPTHDDEPTANQRWILPAANWTGFERDVCLPKSCNSTSAQAVTSAILLAASKNIPLSTGRLRRPRVPWWSETVANAIIEKRRTLAVFRKHMNSENLLAFKRAKALARRAVRQAKEETFARMTEELTPTTDTAVIWRHIRATVGNNPVAPPITLVENGTIITNLDEIPDALGRHFANVCADENYDSSFLTTKQVSEAAGLGDLSELAVSHYNIPFTMEELKYALSRCRPSSPGADNVPYAFLTHLPPNEMMKLLEFYNILWSGGTYPQEWTEAIIVPILKPKKDAADPTSFRPISLTCCLGKLYEKLINYRLVWSLEQRGLIHPAQSGFRRYRSTTDNLVHFEAFIQSAFGRFSHVTAVLFDLEKGYDRIWRFGVIRDLYAWGFRGNLMRFLVAYFSHRTFRVRVGKRFSRSFFMANGLIQGSTLSVTLFAVAMNALTMRLPPTVAVSLYVDDLCLYIADDSVEVMQSAMQSAVDILATNALHGGFRFSPAKTFAVHFCRKNTPHNHPVINFAGSELQFREVAMLLGVRFDRPSAQLARTD